MIFGRISDDDRPDQWFAWYPVRLTDGRIAWWQKVDRWKYWKVACVNESGYAYRYGEIPK
jgi:hypothetical protein